MRHFTHFADIQWHALAIGLWPVATFSSVLSVQMMIYCLSCFDFLPGRSFV